MKSNRVFYFFIVSIIFLCNCKRISTVSYFNDIKTNSVILNYKYFFKIESSDSYLEATKYSIEFNINEFEFKGYVSFTKKALTLYESFLSDKSFRFIDVSDTIGQFHSTVYGNNLALVDTFSLKDTGEFVLCYLLKFPFSSSSFKYNNESLFYFSKERGIIGLTHYRTNADGVISYPDFLGDRRILDSKLN